MVNGIPLKKESNDFKLSLKTSSPVRVELLENALLHLAKIEGVHIGHLGNLQYIHTEISLTIINAEGQPISSQNYP